MYLKLAFRNAKRSVFDYLIYITTMTILIAIMFVSNCISAVGNLRYGFQTASLPLLIVLIMVVLVNYLNVFMLKQRAKEFANYLLLGMEKNKLSLMFMFEFSFIGFLCFFLGGLFGIAIYFIGFSNEFQLVNEPILQLMKITVETLLFFFIAEFISVLRIRKKVYSLQICELMNEKRRNQDLKVDRKNFWRLLLIISFIGLVFLFSGVMGFPKNIELFSIAFISIPLLCFIFTFYKWLYAYLSEKRILQSDNLFQGNRLYQIAEMTTGTQTNALMNAIFCICLLFSAVSFVFGSLLLNNSIEIFDNFTQKWMGFVQISICIIFMVIYFSVLSLIQTVELRQQANGLRILHYMGKSQGDIKSLIRNHIIFQMSLPVIMCIVLLLIATTFINHKLNTTFNILMHNSLISATGLFLLCFLLMYLCYFLIVYAISKRYIKTVIPL